MQITTPIASALVSAIVYCQVAVGSEKPSDLIVGRWSDRAELNDAVIEFLKDGKGTIAESASKQTSQTNISWKMTHTYGNAGIVLISYVQPKSEEAKPLPQVAKPMTWLVVFDGSDTFVSQPTANKIVFMDRQKTPTAKTNEKVR